MPVTRLCRNIQCSRHSGVERPASRVLRVSCIACVFLRVERESVRVYLLMIQTI